VSGERRPSSPVIRGRPRQRSQDETDHRLLPESGWDRRPHRGPDLRRFTSIQEAQDLATFLQIGALPINLKLISQTQVSRRWAARRFTRGFKAGVIALILVTLFLLLYYRVLGLIA